MPSIISTPPLKKKKNSKGYNGDFHFGFFETQGKRAEQEDAITWRTLAPEDITAEGETELLTPPEIADRSYITLLELNNQFAKLPNAMAGATVSTTVYDGKGNLITATLGDSVAFAVVYDLAGNIIGVQRLNSITHKPALDSEKLRIERMGGSVIKGRVNGGLAISRVIGDNVYEYRKQGVSSEATIDINIIAEISSRFGVTPSECTIQVITTCDGFTDGAGKENQHKEGHEAYLLNTLNFINKITPITTSEVFKEDALAVYLAHIAIRDGSTDNVSVAIQTITPDTPAFHVGLYDGHGGKEASCYLAENIDWMFHLICKMTPEAYANYHQNVVQKNKAYERENPVVVVPASPMEVVAPAIELVPEPAAITPREQPTFFNITPHQLKKLINLYVRQLAEQKWEDAMQTYSEFNLELHLDAQLIDIKRINRDGAFGRPVKGYLTIGAIKDFHSGSHPHVLIINNKYTLRQIISQIPGLTEQLANIDSGLAGPA